MESKYQEALDRLCENNYFDEKGNCNCDLIVMIMENFQCCMKYQNRG